MRSVSTTFQQYLQSAFSGDLWATDEVIAFVLPLFEEVASFHDANLVGSFGKPDTVFLHNGRLDIDEQFTHPMANNLAAVQQLLDAEKVNGFAVSGRYLVDEDVTHSLSNTTNLQVQFAPNATISHPVYLRGYGCYEINLGHHDAKTDIFCLGLILGSVVMGLDLYDEDDLNRFAAYRNQPAGLNPRVHPTVCALVTEMTELDRSQRSSDLNEIIQRLKYYRDYDPQREQDLSKIAVLQEQKPADRKRFILSKLRNRLFDTSRRNRLLYYKPNSRFVNLTVSSVPMVLHYQSIRPESLFTWTPEISQLLIHQKDIALNKYLRFEDHPYLNSQLNSIRQTAENDRKEYGFSQLRLSVAFLHWHNLKDDKNERIHSPLLLLPVMLERKKSLKDERFILKITDNSALVNPVLSNFLKDLYGIVLPESIDFDDVSMEEFYQLLEQQISSANQGVKLNYIDKPRIKIVHSIARQTINNYRKKLKVKGTPAFHQVDYSYSKEHYKPLGCELYKQKVAPLQHSLEFLLSDDTATPTGEHFTGTDAPDKVKTKGTFQLADGESNPYSWDFDVCNIVLGNFNYKKMSLVGDYNTIAQNNVEHAVFQQLFSNEPRMHKELSVNNNPADWFHVIKADPTQSRSVLFSRTGESYIIQGPPGTGKSQTITNLIADYLAQGKSVLFVCEKRAALDVVYHRLMQNNLVELCCYIHDSQGDKKEFIRDLRTVYQDFLKNKMDLAAIRKRREEKMTSLLSHIQLLAGYHTQQTTPHTQAGLPTRQLIDEVLRLQETLPNLSAADWEQVPFFAQWIKYSAVIRDLSQALQQAGAEPQFAAHPARLLGNGILSDDQPFKLLDQLLHEVEQVITQVCRILADNHVPDRFSHRFSNVENLVHDATVLERLANSGNLTLVDPATTDAKEFDHHFQALRELEEQYENAVAANGHWQTKFDKAEVDQALAIAQKYEQSFLKFLNGTWRTLNRQLRLAYNFNAHHIKPRPSEVLARLKEEYRMESSVAQRRKALQERYNGVPMADLKAMITDLRRHRGDEEVDFLLQHQDSNMLVMQLSRISDAFHKLKERLALCLYEYEHKSMSQLKDDLATIRLNATALRQMMPALQRFAQLPEELQEFIRKVSVTEQEAEAAMAHRTLQSILSASASFDMIGFKQLQHTAAALSRDYAELLELNSELIRAERRAQFLKHYELSNTTTSVLNAEDRRLKREYADGRRVLEHEMSKTMRYKSIRELASGDTGKVLRDIKPVWLMSPLSVSDSLPLDSKYFDVVIFDEASQVTLEEGIPALFRAPQTIIVGDDKQMPPSNFFNAVSHDPEDLEKVEGENEDEILSADADSLLVQGTRKLNSTMLSWHYRSRYETLISYSNHAFYQAGLLTIPDKTIHQQARPLLEISRPEEGYDHGPVVGQSSISYHYLPNSIYEARSNIDEARYIAHLVCRLLTDNVPETIGVVAFSQEQQSVIEEAIDELAKADKAFEELLEKAFNRKDDHQFTGLFIKNLENVQGDERDIIIMSICYGHDSNKKMLMNFGPINRKGGERRLNVIFSRARKHIVVVASIRHHHITNEHNDGANYFRKFLQYAEMVSTGNMGAAAAILEKLNAGDHSRLASPNQNSITAHQVKAELESWGFIVDENIGQSNFRCTLGVKRSNNDAQYCLGIQVDDHVHYANDDVMEQYCLRPEILRSFGWNVVHVFGKDWLQDKAQVCTLLAERLGHTLVQVPLQPLAAQTQTGMPAGHGTVGISEDRTRFWQVVQQQERLLITFGKSGTTGQSQVMSYTDESEAALARQKFIDTKKQEGYVFN